MLKQDSLNRLIAVRKEGSIGLEVEFMYEGKSRRPVAARLAGRQWHFRSEQVASVGAGSIKTKQCAPALTQAKWIQPSARTLSIPQSSNWAISKAASAPWGLKKVFLPEEEQQMYQTYTDIQDWGNEYYDWLADNYSEFLSEREKCLDDCDIMADALLLMCACLAEFPPLAITCTAYALGVKWACKRMICDKLPQ